MQRTKNDKYQVWFLHKMIFTHAKRNTKDHPAPILKAHLGQERRDGDPGSDKGKRKTGVHRHVEQNIPGRVSYYILYISYYISSFFGL